jgi:hypothetical protein
MRAHETSEATWIVTLAWAAYMLALLGITGHYWALLGLLVCMYVRLAYAFDGSALSGGAHLVRVKEVAEGESSET